MSTFFFNLMHEVDGMRDFIKFLTLSIFILQFQHITNIELMELELDILFSTH